MSRTPGKPASETPELRRLREQIDALDRRIVGLLNERAELTRSVGLVKAGMGRRVRDAGREREVLLRVSMANTGPTAQSDLLAIYRRVIAAARAVETRERVRRDETAARDGAPSRDIDGSEA
jgi:chorismate mutase / prephenate dehydratase